MERARSEWLAVSAVAIVAGVLFAMSLPTGSLMGWDTYPEILTSRIQGFDDFLGTFSEQTAEGHYPFHFYRPVHNLSIAADHAIWDLAPIGYHLSSIAIALATAISLFWLSRSLLGPEARWGPWASTIAYLTLPLHTELIPILSRRMDTLCGLFLLLAIAVEVRNADKRSNSQHLLAAFFTLLSVGSKEPGVVIAPLVFLLVFFLRAPGDAKLRIRAALIASAFHVAAIAVVFSARYFAIGGLGGHNTTDLSASLTKLPFMLGNTLVRIAIVWPQQAGSAGPLDSILISGVALLALLTLSILLWRRREPTSGSTGALRNELLTATTALCAIVMFATIYAATGQLQVWYLYLPALALCLLIGAAAQGFDRIRRQGWRRPGALGLILIVLWIAAQARYSPLFIGYGHWQSGDERLTRFLDDLSRKIESAPETAYVRVPFPPHFEPVQASPNATPVVTLVNSYSIAAWAALRFPSREFEVRLEVSDAARPVSKSGVVVLGIDHRKAAQRKTARGGPQEGS